MITALPGYKVDPANKNAVVPDVVTPNPTGGLEGTMTQPQVPVAPSVPTTPNAPKDVFSANPSPTGNTQFANFLQQAVDRLGVNNDLMKQKNLLVKAIYDSPLTADELATLPPEVRSQVQGYNPQSPDPALRNSLESQLRLTNDSIAGRTGTLNQSIKFLTDEYDTSLKAIQDQKDAAQKAIDDGIQRYGSRAFANLTPDQKRKLEKQAGFESGYLDNLPITLAERQENRLASGTPDTKTPSAQDLKVFINKQIASPDFQALSDADKALYIQSQGGTPYDFGF